MNTIKYPNPLRLFFSVVAFQKALKSALPFLKEQYKKGKADNTVMYRTARQSMIDAEIRRRLG